MRCENNLTQRYLKFGETRLCGEKVKFAAWKCAESSPKKSQRKRKYLQPVKVSNVYSKINRFAPGSLRNTEQLSSN